MSSRRVVVLVAVVACAWSTASCAGAQDTAVADAATGLLDAASSGDGATACSLLAPPVRTELQDASGHSCERAVLDEGLEEVSGAVETQVFDTSAQAVVGTQTLFLARFDGQWLVIGAACSAVPAHPYDCNIGMP